MICIKPIAIAKNYVIAAQRLFGAVPPTPTILIWGLRFYTNCVIAIQIILNRLLFLALTSLYTMVQAIALLPKFPTVLISCCLKVGLSVCAPYQYPHFVILCRRSCQKAIGSLPLNVMQISMTIYRSGTTSIA